jgi:hypothetical protein
MTLKEFEENYNDNYHAQQWKDFTSLPLILFSKAAQKYILESPPSQCKGTTYQKAYIKKILELNKKTHSEHTLNRLKQLSSALWVASGDFSVEQLAEMKLGEALDGFYPNGVDLLVKTKDGIKL